MKLLKKIEEETKWVDNFTFQAKGGYAIATVSLWIFTIAKFTIKLLSRCIK